MIDTNLINQLINQIEAEIADKVALLSLLRKQLGQPVASTQNQHTANVAVVQPLNASHNTPQHRGFTAETPLADIAAEVLSVHGSLLISEMKPHMAKLGVDVARKNFNTTVYTGLARRKNQFRRDSSGRWSLINSEQSRTAQLFPSE